MKTAALFFTLLFILVGCQNITDIFDDSNGSNGEQDPLDKISLTVDKSVYTRADTVHVRLQNSSEAPLFLEGCNQLLIATKTDTGWVNAALWMCYWEGYAVKIPADSSYVLDYPAEYLSGRHRFLSGISFGCKDGEPISSAECDRREIIYSSEFEVRK